MLTHTTEQKLFLVTRPSVQSHLLLKHLNQEINIPVIFLDVKKPMMFYTSEKSILVYDTETASNKSSKIWPTLLDENQSRIKVCLLNCSRAKSAYEKHFWRHFDTVIPDEATPESLTTTIKNMLLNNRDSRTNAFHKTAPEKTPYGKTPGGLTEREYEILHELCKGESNAQIASSFYISENTVRTHLYNIFKKISVTNRIQAVNWINSQAIS
jgi:LuxR family transcriptional regulator of csgAB operon